MRLELVHAGREGEARPSDFADRPEVGLQQRLESVDAAGGHVAAVAPQVADAPGELAVLDHPDRLVDQHRVVTEAQSPVAGLFAVELDGAGEQECVQGALQLGVRRRPGFGGQQVAYVGLLVGRLDGLVVVEPGVEVVEVGDAHVLRWAVQTDEEVLREDVLGVARVDEDVGVGGGRVTDVLRAWEQRQQLGDELVDSGSFGLTLLPLLGVAGVHRRLVGLVVDDQGGDLAEVRPDALEVADQLPQHRGVLLDHGQPGIAGVQVLGVVQRLLLVALGQLERGDPVVETLVVRAVAGEPDDVGEAVLRGLEPVPEELAVDAVLVLEVVEVASQLLVVRVDAQEDVLDSYELHVESALGLPAEQVHGAGQHDDEPVAGVDGLGDDAGEVRGLAALDVPDDQALGGVGLRTRGVGQAFDDAGRGEVELGERGGVPAAFEQVLLVAAPVELAGRRPLRGVPGLELVADDDGAVVDPRERGVERAAGGGVQGEELVHAAATFPAVRCGVAGPGAGDVAVPARDGQMQAPAQQVVRDGRAQVRAQRAERDVRGRAGRRAARLAGDERGERGERARVAAVHALDRGQVGVGENGHEDSGDWRPTSADGGVEGCWSSSRIT